MKKLIGLVMSACAAAMAQAPPTVVTRERIEIRHMGTPATGVMPLDTFTVMSDVGMSVEMALVKGAPFSGEFVTESVQQLVDGNRIVSKRTEVYARDGEGRTRREMGPVTFIHDPVAKVEWVIENQKKTARKMMMPDMGGEAGPGKNVMVFNREMMPATPIAGGAMVRTFSRTAAPGGEMGKFETKTEPLGKRVIEGVEAEGTRTSVTIPAGAVGNELPLVTVSERWMSAELKTVVMTSRKDPQAGETTYRLTNLRKGEPSRMLFEMPADYTIETENIVGPMIHRMRIEKKND